jgi:branched-chain amino acid transport system substrate-binding protein
MEAILAEKSYCLIVHPAFLVGSYLVSTHAAAQGCGVKLSVADPMTGGGASRGRTQAAVTEFGAAWINANGGLYGGDRNCKVVMVSYDSSGIASGGTAASNYYASQRVHAVAGPVFAPETTGFQAGDKLDDQVDFSPVFAVDVISPDFMLAFHQIPAPLVWEPMTIKAVRERFNLKSTVIVRANDRGGTNPSKAPAKLYGDNGIIEDLAGAPAERWLIGKRTRLITQSRTEIAQVLSVLTNRVVTPNRSHYGKR